MIDQKHHRDVEIIIKNTFSYLKKRKNILFVKATLSWTPTPILTFLLAFANKKVKKGFGGP